jgi:ribosome-associated toxin RatA of RatAB toxin-antitoxin module
MADQTSSTILISAPPEAIMAVIADFPAYPEWAQGMRRAEVQGTFPDGRAKDVLFEIAEGPIKDTYTLTYDWHGDESVDWTLVQGKMLKKLDGAYRLAPQGAATGGPTEVTYQLEAELNMPMIGMLRRKAEKVIIDAALKGLKKRVESLS